MAERERLDEYSGQSTDELLSLEGVYRTDSLVIAFEQALDQKQERVGKDRLTNEELVILAIEALEREVNNGGYDQFFFNSSSEYTPIILNALHRAGCYGTAAITQRAIDTLNIDGHITVDAIEKAMEKEDDKRSEILNECDDQCYENAGDLADPLLKFIKQKQG